MKRVPIKTVTLTREVQQQIDEQAAAWQAGHEPIDINGRELQFAELITTLIDPDYPLTGRRYARKMKQFVRKGLPWLAKDQVLAVYRALCEGGFLQFDPDAIVRLQVKPTRSQAGVTVVTVLTKPYPCPGKCIFCPTDARMPKSYLPDEPGAQRAERHRFDPFAQTAARIAALARLGHPTDKIELLILGGTWSSYERAYQEWFVQRCFDALNGVDSDSLPAAQALNETAACRNVGLVVETRQDHIDAAELRWLRYLGVTKVQVGVQSMDDTILALNERGHDVAATRRAFGLLRLAGFKIHAHWMANLLGATPAGDVADYARLWSDPAIRPDELKIYPCMLLANADLYAYWQRGEYEPYSEETLIDVLAACKQMTPRYTRLTRIIRDIPTTHVVAGNKRANLRQLVQARLRRDGVACQCIRCREIRRDHVDAVTLTSVADVYESDVTEEHFLSFERDDGRLAGFLRLALPLPAAVLPLPELAGHAMIREVHVYGPVMPLGEESRGEAQHVGLGGRLIARAETVARAAGFEKLAVISAVGTRRYYARHGFEPAGLYMTKSL